MNRHRNFRALGFIAATLAIFAVGSANATIIGTGDVDPAAILGLENADVSGQDVSVQDGTLTVNGGSNLTARSLRGADNPAATTGQFLFTGAGTTVDLVGDNVNRLDIGVRGTSSLTVSDGAFLDAASAACPSNLCGAFFGNFAGSNANLTVTGANSQLDTVTHLVFGAAGVTTNAVEGLEAGIPGGTTTTTVQILDGGVVNALGGSGSTLIGDGPSGSGTIGTEQSIANVTVDGLGSAFNVGQPGGLQIGDKTNATGTLTIQNEGTLDVVGNIQIGRNGGTGALNVDGAGSTASSDQFIQVGVGAGSNGALNITGGADVTIDRSVDQVFSFINIARDANDAVGRVLVDGAGTTVLIRGNQAGTNVGRNGDGGLEVLNGATYTMESINDDLGVGTNAFLQVGRDDGAVGNLRISGAGSAVNLSGTGGASVVRVGRRDGSDGTLLIEAGGKLANSDANGFMRIGDDAGSVGAATVTGIGSELNYGRNVAVGGAGTGTLDVLSGGAVNGLFVNLGQNGGAGTLTVDGAGSKISLSGIDPEGTGDGAFVTVGRQNGGTGTVNIQNGGVIELTGDPAATSLGFQVGRDFGTTGTVNVDGAGSKIMVTPDATAKVGFANVGRFGDGTLNITGGGSVEGLIFMNVGREAGSNGQLTVDGVGSSLKLAGEDAGGQGAFLSVGLSGNGTVDVTGGAQITIDGLAGSSFAGFQVGRNDGSDGTINVTGPGSAIIVTSGQAGLSMIGRLDGSTGAMNITAGGQVLNNANGINFIGRDVGATGTVTVDGAGSLFDGGAFIGVGVQFDQVTSGGTGTLTVSNGGTVTADLIRVGANGLLTGAGGTINGTVEAFDGGTIAPGSSPGTLIINGDLIIDTGILQLETENGVSDQIIVSGAAQIGGGAMIELFFDALSDVAIEDFFTFTDPLEELEFLAGFDAGDIAVFTSDQSLVGNTVNIGFGQNEVEFTVRFGVVASVPEPGTTALFAIGLLGLGALRRRRMAA